MTRIGDSDLDVFPLNLGGNVFGWTADEQTSLRVLDAFVEGGGNFVDTADSYSAWVPGNSGGDSERIIGQWLDRRGRRDDVVIATKVSQHPDFKGLAAANIKAAVDAGKIRHIGISNFSAARIDEWFAATEADGLHRAVALQPLYSLVERDFETNGLREAAERHGLGVLPFYALASGFLTGKYRPGAQVDSPRAGGAGRYLDDRGRQVLAALDEVAAAHQTSLTAVALAWLRQQLTVVAPIASARTPEQLPDLLASVTVNLSAGEIDLLVESGSR